MNNGTYGNAFIFKYEDMSNLVTIQKGNFLYDDKEAVSQK